MKGRGEIVFDPKMGRRHRTNSARGMYGEPLTTCGAYGRMLRADDLSTVPMCPLCGGPPIERRTRERGPAPVAFDGSETW